MRKIIFIFLSVLAFTMIVIPTAIVGIWGGSKAQEPKISLQKVELIMDERTIPVQVYRTKTKVIETYAMEEYVRGVIAAEMPVDFELEALKAQALAARTYIVKRLLDKDFTDMPEAAKGAIVTDTVQHQVFLSSEDLKKQWGANYQDKINKLNQAINETRGLVITYNNFPITATFFSTSNGYTENSEEYWGKAVPYLRSVESPWDTASPKFSTTKKVSYDSIKSALNISTAVPTSNNSQWMTVIENTAGLSVKKIKIGDKVFTGREVREKLGLNSSSFTWTLEKDGILFNTKGYGHGVGMSQYGANGMAQQGSTAEEIVKYYYQGITLKDYRDWIK